MLGTYALSTGYYDAYYLKAQKVRTLIKRDFEAAFKRCDLIITPTAPTTAFKLGEKMSDPLQMYLSDIFTISVNLAGLPGMAIPCGYDQRRNADRAAVNRTRLRRGNGLACGRRLRKVGRFYAAAGQGVASRIFEDDQNVRH